MKRQILLFGILISLLVSCVNVNKKIESGNYDDAINYLVKKLQGKKNKDDDKIQLLELAFKKANEADLRSISAYKSDSNADAWARVINLYRNIDTRQSKIEPLLPLVSKNGYMATFTFINTEEDKKDAKTKLADQYLHQATQLLNQAKSSNDKNAARDAYNYLSKIEPIYPNYKNSKQLLQDAISLGTNYHLISMENNTYQIIPQNIEDNILSINVSDLNKRFDIYHTAPNKSIDYDQKIKLTLTRLNISPEREKTRVYDEVHETTSEETVKDSRGKVLRDSTGKEIKRKVVKKYTTTIEEVTQLKTVALEGNVEWFDKNNTRSVHSKPALVEAIFENQFARIVSGERDHLNDKCRKKLNNRAIDFPSNNSMLIDAGEKMKNLMKDIIYDKER